ncbi:prostatic acid phosphatase [Aplysia californica]|uniref:acid phosphatase n=1 Tax=Aplysia californica TaxID=6500 RepID=A0ABM0JM79_APLCA|nr:prostatic acid phosphatase [Aplysia californica]XP_005096977.1 prostatic acid phosphatase [Aplysia californica]
MDVRELGPPSMKRLIQLCLCLCCGLQVFGAPPPTLKLVHVLYRHGDRSPAYIYPKDIHQVPGSWPDGLGWLSNIGKQQQYELGQYIAERYSGFLNTSYYHHDQILIQSSGVERCLMSAQSNLAGLFPPQGPQVWNSNFTWQPIPVQTTPTHTDNKLALQAPCPRYKQLMAEVLNSPAIKREEKENKAFYGKIAKAAGVKKESIKDLWMIADALICEKAHNYTWNKWVYEPGVWDKINSLWTLSFDLLFRRTEMAKLKGGPLLKEIINNMKNANKESSPSPRFYMYSAHDTTVAAFLSAMQVFDLHQPMYRALVMVELHQINDDHVVKIFYRNETTADPYELSPPGCKNPCTLGSFVEATKATVPEDWEKECQAQSSPASHKLFPASWITLAFGICSCTILCVVLVVTVLRLRTKRNCT